MKIGYKGLNSERKAVLGRGQVEFEIGKVYSKEPAIENPVLCSSDGYHYCNNLEDVFNHYKRDGKNRFFEIEVLGNYTDGSNKSITTSFRIIRELDSEFFIEWDKEQEKRIEARNLLKVERNLNLTLLKKLQTKHPELIVGGSVALFLHGVKLKRWRKDRSDLDIVAPYYVLLETSSGFNVDPQSGKSSGNDFTDSYYIYDTVEYADVDFRVDPMQKYEYVEYNGFRYKVSTLYDIIEAKMKYARKGQQKHIDDLREIMLGK